MPGVGMVSRPVNSRKEKAMTLHDMAKAVHDMLAYSVQQGYDAKDVTVEVIRLSVQYHKHEVEIHGDGKSTWADVYFSG